MAKFGLHETGGGAGLTPGSHPLRRASWLLSTLQAAMFNPDFIPLLAYILQTTLLLVCFSDIFLVAIAAQVSERDQDVRDGVSGPTGGRIRQQGERQQRWRAAATRSE